MYWFGKNIDSLSDVNWENLKALRLELAKTKSTEIISTLDSFGTFLKNRLNSESLIDRLTLESGFDKLEVTKTLNLLPEILKEENLIRRLRSEFPTPGIQDAFTKTPHFQGKVKASPLGIILHVTAGNIFLSSIDSLIMGLITKNLSIVKVSSQNQFFPMLFAELFKEFDSRNILSNKFAILHWKGGDSETESLIKSKVQGIIAWGGEEMISSYRKDLPLGVKLLDFGPKVSVQVISRMGLENKNIKIVAEKIVQDILPWDQAACASPQNLYLEEGIDETLLLKEIERAFKNSPDRGIVSDDEATEILKEKFRSLYSSFMENGASLSGKDYLIHLEENKFLRPSPLNRSIIVKRFKDSVDLCTHLEPFSYYLQSCSYLLGESEKDSFLSDLSLVGIKRFAPLGTITFGLEGAPHDGRMVLRELVHFLGDEIRVQDYGSADLELQSSKDLKIKFNNLEHPKGYIFSSGGTSGEPKFVHFSYEEFDFVTDMLAQNFRLQGLRPGMTVANLFVAGNLWSSFMAIEKALEKIGVVQLPIGGLCSSENISSYLQKFKPEVVMGIPSMLVMLCEFMDSQGVSIEVEQVYYAGEALSASRQEFLKKNWKTKKFGSAGYASVDAGVIGYQCDKCAPGEHHVFSDLVNLKIVEGEGIVTSLYRSTLPIKNYRTGDRMEWLPQGNCHRSDEKFKLLGRIDNVIQIWSCRLNLEDIEKTFQDFGVLTYQIVLREKVQELMEIYYEVNGEVIPATTFLKALYERSRDLRDTLSFEDFSKQTRLISVENGLIPRNARTGKISLILDRR